MDGNRGRGRGRANHRRGNNVRRNNQNRDRNPIIPPIDDSGSDNGLNNNDENLEGIAHELY